MTVPVAFQGEVMLAGWSQTHNGGAKVTFWLSDEDDLAAFKAMTVAKGKTAGQRLAIVAVEIGDDELPKPVMGNPMSAAAQGFKGGELAKLAGMFCASEEFQRFAAGRVSWPGSLESPSQSLATTWLKSTCEIESRVELDHNQDAAARFHSLVRKPFLAWKESGE